MELEGHEGEGQDPVEEVRDDLDRGGLACVPEESSHKPPELVVVGGGVADVPHGGVLCIIRSTKKGWHGVLWLKMKARVVVEVHDKTGSSALRMRVARRDGTAISTCLPDAVFEI